jgi:hypothetical protein
MAVAFNSSQIAVLASGGGNNFSFSYTCSSGADRLLIAACDKSSTISSATYAGAALNTEGSFATVSLRTKTAPATGANTLTFNVSSYAAQSIVWAADFTGVDGTTPVGTLTTNSGTSTAPATTSITCPANGAIYGLEISGYAAGSAPTAGSGTTLAGTYRNGADGKTYAGGYRLTTGAVTFASGNTAWSAIGIPINPVAGAGADISGSATLGDITASGGMSVSTSDVSGSATLGDITAAGTLAQASGTITSQVLKNNTGTILASVTGIVANVYHPTTGALVVRKTGLSSSGAGVVTITDVLIVAGTTYAYELDLSATSQGRRLPTGVAA